MKKAGFFVICMLLGVLVFGQSLNEYTLITQQNIGNVPNLRTTKYAILCVGQGIVTLTTSGERSHVYQDGNIFMSFDMTAEQERQLNNIRESGETPLVLFTRKGTSRENYRFIVDRFILSEEIFGIRMSDLPRSLRGREGGHNIIEILQIYLNTGKADPDGRVARALGR